MVFNSPILEREGQVAPLLIPDEPILYSVTDVAPCSENLILDPDQADAGFAIDAGGTRCSFMPIDTAL